jgi:hypothetical protein
VHGLAHEVVFDVGGVVDDLGLGVADADVALEPRCDDHVDPLVDARRHDGTAVLLVEVGQVGTTADEADPERRA